jgi:hypothetical protein
MDGAYDDGTPMTFDAGVRFLVKYMRLERHARWKIAAYEYFVSTRFRREKWRKKFGHE